MERYLREQLAADLDEKMVFLGGPRQVGKTTLARALPSSPDGYLNERITAERIHLWPATRFLATLV